MNASWMAWPWFCGHAGHQHPDAQRDEQEQHRTQREHHVRAAERHAEQRPPRPRAPWPGPRRPPEVGHDLAQEHVARPQRHHRELLQRPGLPFPDHAEAGDDDADEHQDHAGHPRNHDRGRLQLGVEEDPDHRAGPPSPARLPPAAGRQRLERRLGREQLAAVDQDHGPGPLTTATAAWPSRSWFCAQAALPGGARATTSNGAPHRAAARPAAATTAGMVATSKLAA